MGVDPLGDAAANTFAKEGEHGVLIRLLAIRLVCHGRSTAAPTSRPSRKRARASLAWSSGKTVVWV